MVIAALLLAPMLCFGQAGIISTIAGGGTLTGAAANGQPGTRLQLGNPIGLAADAANAYICDGGNARVWKVNSAGILTLIGGNGVVGSLGDGGPATSAQITCQGAAVDPAGNVYLAGGVIRKIDTSGRISTFAQVNASAVAIDSKGNLYVSDILAGRIRKIDPAGNVSVFAGSGTSGYSGDGGPATAAALSLPQGAAVDGADNVYFADAGNGRIRKVNPAGIISTVAGNGSPLSLGDGGPATSAGMTPVAVAADRDGNLYICDSGGGRIRKVNASGTISTVAGGVISADLGDGGPATSARLSGPRNVAVDPLGNIYISDDNNRRVRKVSSGGTGASPIQATPASLSFSYTPGAPPPASQQVVIFSLGATLTFTATVSTSGGGNWLSVTPTSGSANNTLAVSVNPDGVPVGVYSGTVIVQPSGDNAAQNISVRFTVNGATSQGVISTVAGNGFVQFRNEGGAAASSALSANAVAAAADGTLYIASVLDSKILQVTPGGTVSTFAGNGAITYAGDGGPAARASFFNPLGVAVDRAGNVYVADSTNNRIRKISGGTVTTVAGNGSAGFAGDGGPATSASLFTPTAVAVDAADNLYIADYLNSRVRKVGTDGIITTVAGGAPLPVYSGDGGRAVGAGVAFPGGVAVDAAGNLYIAEINSQRIRKVDTAGIITTFAGNGSKGFTGDGGPATAASLNLFNSHAGLAVDGAGNVYIADVSNYRIRKVDSTGVITSIAGNGIAGFSGDGGPATSAGLNSPGDVAVDGNGALYIADATNNRVRKVVTPQASAAPSISTNGVVNGASFRPGVIANAWGTIQGANLSARTNTWDAAIVAGQLPTSLEGVSVSIGGKPAYLNYVSPSQINFVAPDLTAGQVQVVVTTAAGSSAAFTVTAGVYGPAFFPWPGQQAVATHQDYTFAAKPGTFAGAATVAAKPGEVIILWGTGLGPTVPAAPAGVQVPADRTYGTTTAPAVTINGVNATVYGAALAPGYAGLYQVAIQVPASLPDGDWPIVTTIGGVSSAGDIVLAVRK